MLYIERCGTSHVHEADNVQRRWVQITTVRLRLQALTRNDHPTFATRATAIKNPAPMTIAPLNICARTKLPVLRFTSAPATGLPMSSPIPAMPKLIPKRVPTRLISVVRLVIDAGVSDRRAPDERPYSELKATSPPFPMPLCGKQRCSIPSLEKSCVRKVIRSAHAG